MQLQQLSFPPSRAAERVHCAFEKSVESFKDEMFILYFFSSMSFIVQSF